LRPVSSVTNSRVSGFRRLALAGAVVISALGVCACKSGQGGSQVVMLATHSSPGGGSDVFLREMTPYLSRLMGATFVVENYQGGSGAKAMAMVGSAQPNGRLFYATTPTFIYTSLLSKPEVGYRELEPLVNLFFDPEVLYTAADSRFATLQDVLDHARRSRGKWGAGNPASLERQTLEQLKQKTGVKAAVVTFEGGGDMLVNVWNRTLDMGIGELQEIRAQLDAGTIRLLAVAGDERLALFPELKTIKEQGIDLSVRKFRGLAGPKGTPPHVIAAWEAAVPKLLDDPDYKRLYVANSLEPGFIPHKEYVAFMNQFGAETERFLRDAGAVN
jgi:putative tricarboxylic transport membrane protein